jgi:hypothetical protein
VRANNSRAFPSHGRPRPGRPAEFAAEVSRRWDILGATSRRSTCLPVTSSIPICTLVAPLRTGVAATVFISQRETPLHLRPATRGRYFAALGRNREYFLRWSLSRLNVTARSGSTAAAGVYATKTERCGSRRRARTRVMTARAVDSGRCVGEALRRVHRAHFAHAKTWLGLRRGVAARQGYCGQRWSTMCRGCSSGK